MAGELLLQMLNRQGGRDSNYSDVLYGQVVSTSPLKIKVENGLELPESLLEAGKYGKSRTVALSGSVSISGLSTADGKAVSGSANISGNVTMTDSLVVGNRVSLIRGHGGNRFYILDKQGG